MKHCFHRRRFGQLLPLVNILVMTRTRHLFLLRQVAVSVLLVWLVEENVFDQLGSGESVLRSVLAWTHSTVHWAHPAAGLVLSHGLVYHSVSCFGLNQVVFDIILTGSWHALVHVVVVLFRQRQYNSTLRPQFCETVARIIGASIEAYHRISKLTQTGLRINDS